MFSALQTIREPAKEPITVEMAKQHTRIDFDADDDLLAAYILAARAWAENYLSRVLVTQQLRWTIAQDQPPGGWPLINVPLTLLALPQWMSLDQLRRGGIQLPRQPVQSIIRVSTAQNDADPETILDPARYAFSLATGRMQMLGGASFPPGGHLAVDFTAGYGDDPVSVPIAIRHAILLMTAFLYEQRGDTEGDPPRAAEMLLTPYRLVTFG